MTPCPPERRALAESRRSRLLLRAANEVGVGQREPRSQRRELHRRACAIAVSVIVERACGRIIDDAVVCIGCGRANHEGVRSECAGGDSVEDKAAQLNRIGRNVEITDSVDVAAVERVGKHKCVRVVAAVKRVGAETAVEFVNAIATVQDVIAAIAVDGVSIIAAIELIVCGTAAKIVVAVAAV